MSRRPVIALLCLAALLATGCRSTRHASPSPTPRPEAAIDEQTYTVITFDGTLDGVSINGQIRMAKDSLIWCSVTKFIELGRAMASPDSVWVNVPIMSRYEAGDYQRVKKLTKVDITFAELQDILESDNAGPRLALLARQAGHDFSFRVKKRQHTDRLTFPFRHPENPSRP